MATPDRVLDLTTDHVRPTVRIDAVDYLLRTSNDLTLDVYKDFQRISPRIGVLLLQDTLTPAEGSELSQLLDRVCRAVLVAPEAVQTRLGDVNRMQVFTVFTQLLTPSLQRATRARTLGQPSAGTNSFPGSNGSTAGVSTPGARPSRSASSRRH